ncbi:Mpv17 / PMP22 family protein [Nitzschia inconspicua]|uniref:Mpv17 / PMP22 family protein n=1 Tax=Nitzschia inconspicua TaxID=303405 RepID=A0A9K3LL58_9STRA|nr:Mpv17 / PMP22 family protein [Nitzschia inconspicua]
MRALLRIAILLWASSVSAATAFVPQVSPTSNNGLSGRSWLKRHSAMRLDIHGSSVVSRMPRGGEQEEGIGNTKSAEEKGGTETLTSTNVVPADRVMSSTAAASVPLLSKIVTLFATIGKVYSHNLEASPILTKSCTAGLIFGLSDYLAQIIEGSGEDAAKSKKSLDWIRLISTTLVGLLYFGPAAHYWYEWIFRLLPGTGLASTLYKAFWGQILFGPSFTCIFFAASLLQAGEFSLKGWWNKIRSDLPGAWLAGVGYWPIVDLISYSVIPVNLIPLFVNMASLVWTVYLSIVANKGKGK